MEYTHDQNCNCPGCLEWDDYDNVYIDFAIEYSRQMLTYTLSVELLSDFPNNIPPNILIPIIAKRHQILTAEMKRRGLDMDQELKDDEADAFFTEAASVKLSPRQHRIRCAYEGLYNLARFGKKMPEMDFPQFDRILVCQNVVVICAFAEGFIANTIRKLCKVRPNSFNSWRKKRRQKLSGLDTSEVLDQYVFEMGYGSFDKKIRRIEKEFSFQVSTTEQEVTKLQRLFLIRNCIVHNAGLISKAYKISGLAEDHLNIGDEVPLQDDTIEELLDTLVDVVVAIYRSVSLDILKKPKDKLMYGAYRNIPDEDFEPPSI